MTQAEKDSSIVRAEVLLRNSDPVKFDWVVGWLRQKGIEVTARGAASLSIRCSPLHFEDVFKTKLRAIQGNAEAPKGVHDFGSLRHENYEAESPLVIPAELTQDVESVDLQTSPRLH